MRWSRLGLRLGRHGVRRGCRLFPRGGKSRLERGMEPGEWDLLFQTCYSKNTPEFPLLLHRCRAARVSLQLDTFDTFERAGCEAYVTAEWYHRRSGESRSSPRTTCCLSPCAEPNWIFGLPNFETSIALHFHVDHDRVIDRHRCILCCCTENQQPRQTLQKDSWPECDTRNRSLPLDASISPVNASMPSRHTFNR